MMFVKESSHNNAKYIRWATNKAMEELSVMIQQEGLVFLSLANCDFFSVIPVVEAVLCPSAS